METVLGLDFELCCFEFGLGKLTIYFYDHFQELFCQITRGSIFPTILLFQFGKDLIFPQISHGFSQSYVKNPIKSHQILRIFFGKITVYIYIHIIYNIYRSSRVLENYRISFLDLRKQSYVPHQLPIDFLQRHRALRGIAVVARHAILRARARFVHLQAVELGGHLPRLKMAGNGRGKRDKLRETLGKPQEHAGFIWFYGI